MSRHRSLPPIQTVPTAGSPRQYRTGACVLVLDVKAWLCRDDGGFYAVDAWCPHLGGDVRPLTADPASDGWFCVCHASQFDGTGQAIDGPAYHAPRGLRFFYLDVNTDGHLVIRRDRLVDPRDRFMA